MSRVRSADVFGRAAAAYDSVIPFFETFGRHLVTAAQLEPGERVLDVACGRGAVLRAAAVAVGDSGFALGVDLSPEMVEEARKELRRKGLTNAALRVADAERLDRGDCTFDAVLCGFGVFFLDDPAGTLVRWRRLLRSGGRFAASTFAGEGGGGYPWERDVLREIGHDDPEVERPLRSAGNLQRALLAAGFTKPTTTTVEGRFVFGDVDEYVAWNWSHGGRRILERLSEDELAQYRAASAERLEAHAVPGGFELRQTVALTVAQAPTGS